MARRKTTRKVLIAVLLGAGGLAIVAWLLDLAYISLDESATPPTTSLSEVPTGAESIRAEKICASGGCWQEATIVSSVGESPDELAARMGLTAETCSPGNIVDPRNICRGSTTSRDGRLVIYVSYWSRGY